MHALVDLTHVAQWFSRVHRKKSKMFSSFLLTSAGKCNYLHGVSVYQRIRPVISIPLSRSALCLWFAAGDAETVESLAGAFTAHDTARLRYDGMNSPPHIVFNIYKYIRVCVTDNIVLLGTSWKVWSHMNGC